MAAFWLIVAAGLFVWKWRGPDNAAWNLRGTDFSLGWVALLLALYNVARWWSRRSAVRRSRSLREAYLGRHRSPEGGDPGSPVTPDPQFDFTDHSEQCEEKRAE